MNNISESNELAEMKKLHHEMNDINMNDNAEEDDSLNEIKEVLNCKFCNKHVIPLVEKYTPFFVYIIIFLLFIFISFFTIFLLPLLYMTFKQKKYICPICKKKLIPTEKIFKIKKEKQIIIFQFPKCAIIISIKYLILFLSLIFLIFLFYIIRKKSNFNLENISKGPYITASWVDYINECGNKSQFRNKFYSDHNFKKKYYGKTVKWKGMFYQIKEGFFNSNSLYIRMNPSEYRYNRPDLEAIFNNSLISQVENLQKDDYIEFECTLIEISKNKNSHICLLWNVILLKKYEKKNFDIIDFVKHLSVIDMINNNTNPNPFFVNLNDNNNIKRSIKIVHFSSNDFRDPQIIPDKEKYAFNLLNNEIDNSNDDNEIYINPTNNKPHIIHNESDEEDEYDDEMFELDNIQGLGNRDEIDNIYGDRSNYYHFNPKEKINYDEYEKAYSYEREFEEEKHVSTNHENNNKEIDYKKEPIDVEKEMDKKTNQKINEKENEEIGIVKNENINEVNKNTVEGANKKIIGENN